MQKESELAKIQKVEIQALEGLPNDQIDTTDVPDILDWSGAKREVKWPPISAKNALRHASKKPTPASST